MQIAVFVPLIELFLKSALIAFTVAIPIGPMAMLCVKYTISHNYKGGISAGLGVALADVVCAGIAGFGVGFIIRFMSEYSAILRIGGGLFLLLLGLKELLKPTVIELKQKFRAKDAALITWSTFFLTVMNPLTIGLYLAVFPAFDIHSLELAGITSIVIGVFLGAMLWWNILVSLVCYFKNRASLFLIKYANIANGFIMSIFGLAILIEVLLSIIPVPS